MPPRVAIVDPSDLERVDDDLARLGRGAARIRLRLGEALVRFSALHGPRELGFSSFAAYVRQACQREGRWAAESRTVARKLCGIGRRGLPKIRAALFDGTMLWSMAELLARYATPEDEDELVAAAQNRTVLFMRGWLAERAGGNPGREDSDDADHVPLRIEVGGEELALFEISRTVVEANDGFRPSDNHLMTALLAEGLSSFRALGGGRTAAAAPDVAEIDREHDALEQRRRVATERARAAESAIPRVAPLDLPSPEPPLPSDLDGLDSEIRRLAAQLAVRDLQMGRLARALIEARGWKHLGYASLEQYARERVGVSASSLKHRAMLARRCDQLPSLAEALITGRIGYQAALLIGRLANPDVIDAWIARAAERTYLALREEVEAVELRVRLDSTASRLPPDEQELEDARTLPRAVYGGSAVAAAAASSGQTSVTAGTGTTIALWVTEETRLEYQWMERWFTSVAPRGTSFLGFLIESLCRAWVPLFLHYNAKWRPIYIRDCMKCSSPVCDRRDVTLHHIEPKGRGGADEPWNVVSVCSQCHIHGIHAGTIRISGTASDQDWELGRQRGLRVQGRGVL